MTVDTSTPRSRRVLLTAALGAGAAAIASALGRPLPAFAADGQAVLVGGEYTATSETKITQTTASTTAIWGNSASGFGVRGSSTSHVGVQGSSTSYIGVYGISDSGEGVYAFSDKGTGVQGTSTSDIGIHGSSSATAMPAILGRSAGGSTGVQGFSGSTSTPAASVKTGVYGYAVQDASATGVLGQSTAGRGVVGVATSGVGVRAAATSGIGVYASATGTAGHFATSGPKIGTALRTIGRVRFDNSVGIATIASGTSSVTVTPGIDLSATSAVVATLQGDAGGSTTVKRVVVDATADTFTIYLTGNTTAAVKVAWHVFG